MRSPAEEQRLRKETIRLLEMRLSSNPIADSVACLQRTLGGTADALLAELPREGTPYGLATAWVAALWEAKCIDDHSPLYLLLTECYRSQDPRIEDDGFQDFNAVLHRLDQRCRVDEVDAPPPAAVAPSPARLAANPYRGLQSFEEAHRANFFGRQDDVKEVQDKLARHRLVAIIGASGSVRRAVPIPS